MSSNLLTPKEAAGYLKVSEKTLEGWRSDGIGPKFYRMGTRRVRYFMADITAWLCAQSGHLKASMPTMTYGLGIPTNTQKDTESC